MGRLGYDDAVGLKCTTSLEGVKRAGTSVAQCFGVTGFRNILSSTTAITATIT